MIGQMSEEALEYQGVYRSVPVPSCLLSRGDLIALYEKLSEKAREGLERSLADAKRPTETPEEEFDQMKEKAREVGRLSAFIVGADGEQIAVSSVGDFRSQRLPDQIESVTYDSAANLKAAQGWEPVNRFRLTLDFTEPPGFHKYDPTAKPTPNESNFEITGPDSTWVTGVHETVKQFLENRGTRRGWLHKNGTYILYQAFVMLPGALWLVVRFSQQWGETIGRWHSAIEGAVYVYVFLLALWFLRVVAYGFRWAYPLIEFEGARSQKARGVITLTLSTLLLSLVYDVLRGLIL